jgi:hypothetical protein
MTTEITSLRTLGPLPVFDTTRSPELQRVTDEFAAGQKRVRDMAAEIESQRRAAAQATFDNSKHFVLETLRNAKKLMALGGDMHGMVRMVESSLRMAMPAIKTLRDRMSDPLAYGAFTKQVRDLTNVAEQVGLLAKIAARDPNAAKRVDRSKDALEATLRQTRALTGFRIFV